jgi:Dyp-type peroxidase family
MRETFAQINQPKSEIFGNLFLSMAGYMHLGFPYGKVPTGAYYRAGMKDPNTRTILSDPPVNQWESAYQKELHTLLILASDDQTALNSLVDSVKADLAGLTEAIHQETGFVMSDPQGDLLEHFGFRDGLSQPLFFQSDIDRAVAEQGGKDQWDPSAPLNLVLLQDSLVSNDENAFGSYFVYRKLEKDVRGWDNDIQALAQDLGISPELAGAYVVGRFPDGTPVYLSQEANTGFGNPFPNNFNYSGDQQGIKCPFHAHVRKSNPRGDTGTLTATPVPLEEERMHRIVRRGISFGASSPQAAREPSAPPSGSLFTCFMANIMNQFNFMMQIWSNNKDFVNYGVGSDPVIGKVEVDSDGNRISESYQWPTPWGTTTKKPGDFTHWATLRGGEYFFAPSMSFVKSPASYK